jgi:hypothetical protein
MATQCQKILVGVMDLSTNRTVTARYYANAERTGRSSFCFREIGEETAVSTGSGQAILGDGACDCALSGSFWATKAIVLEAER